MKIGFKNDADGDTDSYMWFETGDNGNEYFKWRSKQSTTTKDLMNLKWDALSVLVKALFSSEVKISTVNALRIFNSSLVPFFAVLKNACISSLHERMRGKMVI